MAANIVIPEIKLDERPGYAQNEILRRCAEEMHGPAFRVPNVVFVSDPNWRSRTMSIQAVCDRRGIWRGVAALFAIAQLVFAFNWFAISRLAFQ